jgi:hypothetical protein
VSDWFYRAALRKVRAMGPPAVLYFDEAGLALLRSTSGSSSSS